MKKTLFVVAATMLLVGATTPAMAAHPGQFGLGVLNSDFPIGLFIGMNDKTTVAFGLDVQKPDTDSADNGEQSFGFGLGGALEYNLWGGSNWGFGVFPQVGFATQSYEDITVGNTTQSVDSSSQIMILLALGGHYDPVDSVSLYFAHGLGISNNSPPGGGDSSTNIGTFGDVLGSLGVAFYLP
jgi:hypothetical protein